MRNCKLFSLLPAMVAVFLTAGTARAQQLPVNLGSNSTFAILAGTTVTVTGGGSITGDIGVSPGSTFVPGTPPVTVNGTIYLGAGSAAAQAQLDLTTAFNDAAGRPTPDEIVSGNIGGRTLTPGLYKSTSSLAISSGELTLDAQGDGNAVFIFQIASSFTMTSGRQVILAGGANAENIFWQVGSSATLGTTSVLHGNILAGISISALTGSQLHGRALAGLGAVTNEPATGAPALAMPLSFTLIMPTVTIGGAEAVVSYSGLAPGFAGLYQVNAIVPEGASAGSAVPVVLSIGGVTSNTVTIAVQ